MNREGISIISDHCGNRLKNNGIKRYFEEQRYDQSKTVYIGINSKKVICTPEKEVTSIFQRVYNPKKQLWHHQLKKGIKPRDTVYLDLSISEHIINVCQNLIINHYTDLFQVMIQVEKRNRKYINSEGIYQKSTSTWCEVTLQFSCDSGTQLITDGTHNFRQLEEIIKRNAQQWKEDNYDYLPLIDIKSDYKTNIFILNPTVSSILFHEIIGHSSEENDPHYYKVFCVGPEYLQVKAKYPGNQPYDDEGIPVQEICLVKNGRLYNRVTDRETAVLNNTIPSGLAQAGTHQGKPRARCSHLRVEGGSIQANEAMPNFNRAIYCLNASGGEYYDGFCILQIHHSILMEKGRPLKRVSPFTMIVPLQGLNNHIEYVCKHTVPTRAARCIKHYDSIPTYNEAPVTILKDITIL